MDCATSELTKITTPFAKENGMYNRYSEAGNLEAVIEKVLENSSYVKDYDINSNELFDSPGYTCGYIMVAWVSIDNSLHTQVYEWDY